MPSWLSESLIILLLIFANAVFALAEIAVVSARTVRLQSWAESGDRGAAAALLLKNQPDQFLATVQVGITLIGVLTGAFGGATLAEQLAEVLGRFPLLHPYREALALAAVVSAITYLSLVVGELVPKRLALSYPDRYAASLARPMQGLARLTGPAVALLSGSTSLLVRLLGMKPDSQPRVTEEELRVMIQQGADEGVIEAAEQEMVEAVLRLGDRRVSSLGTPRRDVRWLDVNAGDEELRRLLATHHHSRLPVCDGGPDTVRGVVNTRRMLLQLLTGQPLSAVEAMEPPLFVPETVRAVRLLELFRESGQQFAVVVDEHGGTSGIVTLTDLVEAILGDLPGDAGADSLVARADGTWLVDGTMLLDELRDRLDLSLPASAGCVTIGGLVADSLGHIPAAGEQLRLPGLHLEVVDMDGLRVDKLLLSRDPPAEQR